MRAHDPRTPQPQLTGSHITMQKFLPTVFFLLIAGVGLFTAWTMNRVAIQATEDLGADLMNQVSRT
ncbi:MAG: hypothetical protein HQL53_01060, partial [Magnetococcales bacterium]|nr:hypothetical protein [Magnetococcales bacterium]